MTNEVPVTIRSEGSKTVVDIETENVDFRNAELIKGMLSEQVQQGNKDLVLNLRQVNFMDSSGLSVLLAGKRVTEEVGGSFSICGLQGYVNNLINLTNLNKVIAVFATDAEATKN
jgi:anti-sigma B factor antagonist